MKYALIGCGRISGNHIRSAITNKLEITAVCDVIPEAMDELLKRFKLEGSDIKRYTNYKQMISENELDLVAIATDSGYHAEIAIYCIEHKINVIVEKPIAMSIEDADRIIAAGEKYGVKVCANHQNRFNIAVQKARHALDEGRFGKLSHGSIHVLWSRGESYYKQAPWRGTWALDGGCLMNQCIHGIDLLRWMMGDEIEEVYGVTNRRFHDYIEAEDIGIATVKFKNGAVGTIEGTTNAFANDLEETLYIFGEKGNVKIGGASANTIDVWKFADGGSQDMTMTEKTENIYGNGHISIYMDMIQAINENRQPYVDAYAGKRALEVVLAIYKSAAEGHPVKLPLESCSSADFKGRF